ncbi:MAG: glycoside hydrolase family 3 C-terminal domain-containing protein [Clostridium sp.]
MVTDGPHGLRKQAEDADHLGINNSVPATCFSTACTTACSFDRDLMFEIGKAIGEECQQEKVAVVLGPGVNIKRSPLCGRNFEYVSEDPYVAGQIASALISGVQSQGVGTSLKHFAGNNQEKGRMISNSVIDERALREIYLAGFEEAVKSAQPWTVMCSYNLLNGIYASENKTLLTDILRTQWGFKGLVMTDWGATNDRVMGVEAGLDLEMPASNGINDALIVKAVQEGKLPEEALDKVAERVVELILKAQENQKDNFVYDKAAHHNLAVKAAEQSAVLLKNQGNILPAALDSDILVVGAFAKTPRYQGAGSSKINPTKLDNTFEAIEALGGNVTYSKGYSLKDHSIHEDMIEEACKAAKGKEKVFIFAGLPDEYESEGFDRTNLDMPESHNKLIEEVASVNENVVVVLLCGAPVVMPWADKVKGILLAYLGGQGTGTACANLLYGKANPSGKLAETFPTSVEENPSFNYFPGGTRSVEYRESIFVGYRYYDTAKKTVAYPFGFGLSYTSFEYSNLKVSGENHDLKVEITVTNTGKVSGAEVIQLYVSKKDSSIFRAEKEIKGFEKVFLAPGESKTVEFNLNKRSFAYYNVEINNWAIEGGAYEIKIGASSRDLRLSVVVDVLGDGEEAKLSYQREVAPRYFNLTNSTLEVDEKEFEAVYGRELPPSEMVPGSLFNLNSSMGEIQSTQVGQQVLGMLQGQMAQMFGGEGDNEIAKMMEAMVMDMPLRNLIMMSQGQMGVDQLNGMIYMMNEEVSNK